jgi:hypothetical protein
VENSLRDHIFSRVRHLRQEDTEKITAWLHLKYATMISDEAAKEMLGQIELEIIDFEKYKKDLESVYKVDE